jgi:hypothetical protein
VGGGGGGAPCLIQTFEHESEHQLKALPLDLCWEDALVQAVFLVVDFYLFIEIWQKQSWAPEPLSIYSYIAIALFYSFV